jgi:hypothetical protein
VKIVRTHRYLKDLKRLAVSPQEMAGLELTVASDPTAGAVIRGLAGLRKVRFAFGGRGKSGGGRAIYYLMLTDECAVMLTVYAKNEKSDLSSADRKALLALLKELKDG